MGTQLPSAKGTHTPTQFSSHRWMDENATWYGSRPRPRPHCIRQGPSSPNPRKGHNTPASFGPCLLWPRSPISATAELLFYSSPQWSYTLQWATLLPAKLLRFIRDMNPHLIHGSIGSAVFAGLTTVTDRQTTLLDVQQ